MVFSLMNVLEVERLGFAFPIILSRLLFCLYSACYVRILGYLSHLLLLVYLFDGFVSVLLCHVHCVDIASYFVIIIYLFHSHDFCSFNFCSLFSCEMILHLRKQYVPLTSVESDSYGLQRIGKIIKKFEETGGFRDVVWPIQLFTAILT